jgi:hypothetical protein
MRRDAHAHWQHSHDFSPDSGRAEASTRRVMLPPQSIAQRTIWSGARASIDIPSKADQIVVARSSSSPESDVIEIVRQATWCVGTSFPSPRHSDRGSASV